MKYSRMYGLQPADRIIEPIFQTGLSQHHAIYLGGDANGVEWIAENFKFKGVRLIKASEYFTPGKKINVKKFTGTYADREVAVKRALSLMGKSYDLILFNCEHYAEYVQTGKACSKQVDLIAGVLAVAGTIALVIGIVNLSAHSKSFK